MTTRDAPTRPTADEVASRLRSSDEATVSMQPDPVTATRTLAPSPAAPIAERARSGHKAPMALGLLGAIAAAVVVFLLVRGGGDEPSTEVTTTTAVPATTATTADGVSCAELDAQREALEEQKKELGKLYKKDKDARKAKKREIEDQLRALDEQEQTCAA